MPQITHERLKVQLNIKDDSGPLGQTHRAFSPFAEDNTSVLQMLPMEFGGGLPCWQVRILHPGIGSNMHYKTIMMLYSELSLFLESQSDRIYGTDKPESC